MMYSGCITKVNGIKVGHYSDQENKTGCTVILCEEGATAGVDVRGAAPGTRETDLLKSENLVQQVHGIMLSGGSAFGLDSAGGVMQYLSDNDIGLDTGYAKVPIVPAAVLYDLGVGNPNVRPNKENGYTACANAKTGEVGQGSVGAGTGATVGKALGMEFAQEGGIGTASIELDNGIVVGCITAVNALGDIVDDKGNIVAGAYKNGFLNILGSSLKGEKTQGLVGSNTTIGVLATNIKLTKPQANKLASICQDGLARAIRPSHTMFDGDTYFAVSTDEVEGDFTTVCTIAVECVFRSIINAIGGDKN